MTQNQVGCQTVGRQAASGIKPEPSYNDKGSYCELSRIQIEPCCKNSGNGDPADESLCGSYRRK